MSTSIPTVANPQLSSPESVTAVRHTSWQAYRFEIRCEILRYLRAPSFMLPVLLFPTMFYILFGVILNHGPAARLLLGSYLCFGVMSPGLYGFGVSLAMERDNGLLHLKRIQPAPPGSYLLAKLVMAILVGLIVGVLMLALGIGLAHVSLSLATVARLLLLAGLGVIPFAALGMWVGTLLGGQGGSGLINLVYMPMAMLSGLWFPLSMLPRSLQLLAPIWPSRHLNQLALDALDIEPSRVGPHLLVLLGYTVLFMWLAIRRLQRRG